MTEIFKLMAEKAGYKDESQYGLSGDMKKTQYVLELIGKPSDPETLKCIIVAAEQGMEMNCYSMITDAIDKFDELITEISPFSITPCLKEADFITCGGSAITSFIDSRGLGYALTPRNATLAAMQDYWVDIAVINVAPHISSIVDEAITKKCKNPSYISDMQVINTCCADLEVFFDALNQQLQGNKYIVCDKYTWADLHWTVYSHLCEITGCNALIEEKTRVKEWFNRIKTKKSQCGQNLIAYEMLPDEEETLQGKLKSVQISDF